MLLRTASVLLCLFFFSPIFFTACQTRRVCQKPGIQTPQSVAILGDSRMFDPVAKNFGGFTNYLNAEPARNAFTGTQFVYEDKDPATASNIPGSDAYCSVANTALQARANSVKVFLNAHDGLILSVGVNSTGDPPGTMAAMDAITSAARQKGWVVFITTIGPWKSYETSAPFYQQGTQTINEWIRASSARGNIVIDSYRILEDKNNPGSMPQEYTLDGLHYSALGHTLIANEANRLMTSARECQDPAP